MQIRVTILLISLLLLCGCAGMQPINARGPRTNQPPYPAVVYETAQRNDAVSSAWAQISSQQGAASKTQLELEPVTATIKMLPANLTGPLYLPKVGTSPEMSAEERRESLRRFLNEWKILLGAEPAQLTLLTDSMTADGLHSVSYEQRPFSYPLRGAFGKVDVRFTNDRRITNVSSTAIPDTAKIQASLVAAAAELRGQDVAPKLAGLTVPYNDSTGTHTFTITSPVQATPQQLVVYPKISTNPSAIEFHLVWEVSLQNAPVAILYFDSLRDEVVATQ